MSLRSFRLTATVITEAPEPVRSRVENVLGPKARVLRTADGLRVEVGAVVAVDPREINRRLLSEMRRVDEGAKLRSEWTAGDVTERFRDYVFVKERLG
jgi:hypothetical protein